MRSQRISQLCLHNHTFNCNWNKPYLPLPFQLQLVLIYWPWRDGRLSWPGWLVTQRDSLSAWRQSPIPLLTGLNVEQLHWLRQMHYRYTKLPRQVVVFLVCSVLYIFLQNSYCSNSNKCKQSSSLFRLICYMKDNASQTSVFRVMHKELDRPQCKSANFQLMYHACLCFLQQC